MRAPVRMTRSRGTGREAKGTADAAGTPPRLTARVRNRLVASVAVVAVAVLAASAPGIAAASRDLSESQDLVSRSELNGRAVVLAHSLADERDSMTAYVAAGRSAASGATAVSESRRARVDRRLAEIRGDAPAELRKLLGTLPKTRQQALSGKGSATETYQDYTAVVLALHAVTGDLASRLPARASGGAAEALPALGRAVEQSSATRGLLVGALTAGRENATETGIPGETVPDPTAEGVPQLVGTAQRTGVQEQAALADFEQTAPSDTRESYASTVNGTEITTAEGYLKRLTDQPRFSTSEAALDPERVESALSERIDRMRAVESALTTAETERLSLLRDDDVTALELRAALAGVCLLLAVGISMSAARSMTRPLAVLRLGARRVAADPLTEEPVRFTGRNDEYAEVVRAINDLRDTAVRLNERADQLGGDRTRLVKERQRLADQREELLRQKEEVAERLSGLQGRTHGSFVNLSLRGLALIERQLGVIEVLEDQEEEPERLDTLYKLDHLATRMRRHNENLLVLAGSEPGGGHSDPVPLLDVLRAAISEIERYQRVQIQSLPTHAHVAGFAADSISHLVAELLENATAFSPPDANVQLSGWLLESGEVMLSVQDEGIGMTANRMAELNARLADPDADGDPALADGEDVLGLGLYVVARLAVRHGVRVQLREQKQGGVAAVVVLPQSILPADAGPTATGPVPAHATPGSMSLPGSVAEANSNTLPTRTDRPTPRWMRDTEPTGEPTEPPEFPSALTAPDASTSPEAPDGPGPQGPAGAHAAPTAPEAPDAAEPGAHAAPDAPAAPDASDALGARGSTGAHAAPAASASPEAPAAPGTHAAPDAPAAPDASDALDPRKAPGAHAAPGEAVAPDDFGAPAAPGGAGTRRSAGAHAAPESSDVPDLFGAHGAASAAQSGPVPESRDGAAAEDEYVGDGPVAGQDADVRLPGQGVAHPITPAPAPEWTSADAGADADSGEAQAPFGAVPDADVHPTTPGPAQAWAPRPARDDEEGPGLAFPETTPPSSKPLPRRTPANGATGKGAADTSRSLARSSADDPLVAAAEAAVEAAERGGDGVDNPYRIGPDEHAHSEDGDGASGGDQPTRPIRMPNQAPAEELPKRGRSLDQDQGRETDQEPGEVTTDKGLPKRTPRVVATAPDPARERTGSVDAEALRRRLGGFQKGAREGHRDAQAEYAERTGEHHQTGDTDEGGTVEEARG